MKKVEEGVMVMKDGKGWGVLTNYDDGYSTSYGWVEPESAIIVDSEFCIEPSDITWENSHYEKELETGKVVRVRRTTKVEVEIVE